MSYERRPDRRPGGGRPGGPGRPDRPGPPRDRGRDRGDFSGHPPRDRGGFRDRPPGRGGSFGDRPPPERGGFAPRGADEGGMSIRLDPRRLAALKLLAAEAGVRPGELVTHWVEERLDAARAGGAKPGAAAAAPPSPAALAALTARVDELTRRLDALGAPAGAGDATAQPPAEAPRRRGRPPRSTPAAPRGRQAAVPRVPLHEEIAAVITERGPSTAAELAAAIRERGRYAPPRSARPLDAATISARVSNPVYRARFVRAGGRIALADPTQE